MKSMFRSPLLAIVLVMAIAVVAFGFTSEGVYNYGKQDKEVSMAVVAGGVTVTAGQAVYIAYADTQSLDTAAVVTNSGVENGAVFGIAESGGTGGTMIRVVTRGYVASAFVNGYDSGAAAGVVRGTILSGSVKNGAIGAASTFMTAATAANAAITAAQAAATVPFAISLGTVASTDTGGAYKYPVYVFGR